MKELLMGLSIGLVAGVAIGMSDCGRDLACSAKKKIKKLCSSAEKELKNLEKNIEGENSQNDQNQQNNAQ